MCVLRVYVCVCVLVCDADTRYHIIHCQTLHTCSDTHCTHTAHTLQHTATHCVAVRCRCSAAARYYTQPSTYKIACTVYAQIHVHAHICTHTRKSICTRTHAHICTHTHKGRMEYYSSLYKVTFVMCSLNPNPQTVLVWTRLCFCKCVCMCACTEVIVGVNTHAHMHMHTHTHRHRHRHRHRHTHTHTHTHAYAQAHVHVERARERRGENVKQRLRTRQEEARHKGARLLVAPHPKGS